MMNRRDALGRTCLWVSLGALYALLGMKVFVAWREGVWLDWPLGDHVPDEVVRRAFAAPAGPVRSALVWVLGQDVLYLAAAVSLVLWLLSLSGAPDSGNGSRQR